MKNGVTFTTVIEKEKFNSGIWDPYFYRNTGSSILSDFVKIEKIKGRSSSNLLPFEPIEYKDIPKGNIIGFNLVSKSGDYIGSKLPVVSENTLLFGTMRAYLGNVVVTPKANWIGFSKCWFAVNSEFVQVIPKDGLVYFWWAFLKSPNFLSTLPTGTGGTRPRSNPEHLLLTPVSIPALDDRIEINGQLARIAEKHWNSVIDIQNTLNKSGLF